MGRSGNKDVETTKIKHAGPGIDGKGWLSELMVGNGLNEYDLFACRNAGRGNTDVVNGLTNWENGIFGLTYQEIQKIIKLNPKMSHLSFLKAQGEEHFLKIAKVLALDVFVVTRTINKARQIATRSVKSNHTELYCKNQAAISILRELPQLEIIVQKTKNKQERQRLIRAYNDESNLLILATINFFKYYQNPKDYLFVIR